MSTVSDVTDDTTTTNQNSTTESMSARQRSMRRLLARKDAMVAAGFLVFLIVVAIVGPMVVSIDPDAQDLRAVLAYPSADHWLGTDNLGRDIFSRLVSATRVALLASIQAVAVAAAIGIPIGLFIGFKGGWWDRIVMRLVEGIVSIPSLVLAISTLTIIGPGLTNAMYAIGIVYGMAFLRLTRGAVLAAREELYVDASRTIGTSDTVIMFRHILPNVSSSLIVQATLAFGAALLAEAGLSFLGLGVQPPQASWGSMLAESAPFIGRNWFIPLPPGIAIALTVLAFNVVGDAIRDSLGRGVESGQLRRATVTERIPEVPIPGDERPEWLREEDFELPTIATDDRDEHDGVVPQISHTADGRARDTSTAGTEPTLLVRSLEVSFRAPRGGSLTAVSGVSFHIGPGETLGLVGESGCGKSATALSLIGLLPSSATVEADKLTIAGRNVAKMDRHELRQLRGGDVGVIFQDPMTSLNPGYTIGTQLTEAMRLHDAVPKDEIGDRAQELLELVHIKDPASVMRSYPHEMSGGMAQRVMIAMALSCTPSLLIADEPTTALDVTVQGQVLDLLREVQEETGTSILFITHDLGVVADICDRAAVMYAGQLVETAPIQELFDTPRHPYTRALLESRPDREAKGGRLPAIAGSVPAPGSWPTGCRFAPRCSHAADGCERPQTLSVTSPIQLVRCWRADELSASQEETS